MRTTVNELEIPTGNQRALDERAIPVTVSGGMVEVSPQDAFGRVRVSEPYTLFDSKLIHDAAPLFWDDQQISGGGTTSTYDKTNAKVTLQVSASTAGVRVRQTYRRFNYQPGKSQQVMMTLNLCGSTSGVTKRIGLLDSYNGYYLQQTADGVAFGIRKNGLEAELYAQTAWNSDRLDGTGPSGVTFDQTKTQILFLDFEWLGVGTVRFGFVINGQFIVAHKAHHANLATDVYTSVPNLPLRYEITADGTNAVCKLDAICSTVISEGGFEKTGIPRTVDRGTNPFVTLNAAGLYPVLGLRLKSSGTYASIVPTGMSLLCTSTAALRYCVVANPNISGDTVAWTAVADSAVEYANATDVTGSANVASSGTLLYSGYTQQQNESAVALQWSGFWSPGTSLSGRSDELWLCAQRLSTNAETLYGSITFLEQI